MRTVGLFIALPPAFAPIEKNIGQSVRGKKISGSTLRSQKKIIVEVNIMFVQARNTVQIGFYHPGIKRRQAGGGYNLAMVHHSYFWMPGVQPVRNLIVRDNENPAHPRRIAFQRTQGVPQFLVVPEKGKPVAVRQTPFCGRQVCGPLGRKLFVIPIHPSIHHIYGELWFKPSPGALRRVFRPVPACSTTVKKRVFLDQPITPAP